MNTARKTGEQMAAEDELLGQARAGDAQALNQLVELCWQPLYRYIFYRVRHKEETEEITQETLLKVIAYLPKFEERGIPFRSFLLRVAANMITDHWRKKSRSWNLQAIPETLALPGDSLDELAILAERKRMLDSSINMLPEEQRQVVLLRLVEGFSIKEAANIMQKTEGALKMLQQRALQNIRKYIKDQAW